jgi:hypothetical protein
MPRSSIVVSKLIQDKQNQLAEDRAQLSSLKERLIASPSEYVQKSINAMRQTIANSLEDIQDLQAEADKIAVYEASEAGKQHQEETRNKFLVVDAAVDVCMHTAAQADAALFTAWRALRRHHAAHKTLRDATGAAYGAIADGMDYDVHGDQIFLVNGYQNLSNSGGAIAEWLIESLAGYELGEIIQVKGIQLNHNEHLTLQKVDGVGLSRMWTRLKEMAQRCGVTVHAEGHPATRPLAEAILNTVNASVK